MSERTHGVCANRKEMFHLSAEHVAYSGLLWCSEECLAEHVAENNIDVDKVADELEHRSMDIDQ